MNDTPLEFGRVMAFYKGSVFPMVFPYGPATWPYFTQRANEAIVSALRMGDSIPQQIAIHLRWLNDIDACMYATEAAKPQWTAQDKVDDLCRAFGHDIIAIAHIWYLAIWCLARFGVLKTDNDQHGFVFEGVGSSEDN